jgi:hypothetical protein
MRSSAARGGQPHGSRTSVSQFDNPAANQGLALRQLRPRRRENKRSPYSPVLPLPRGHSILKTMTVSCAKPRVRPNPSLERRPHEAGRLGRATELVYHRPRGQGVLPRGSPQLAR